MSGLKLMIIRKTLNMEPDFKLFTILIHCVIEKLLMPSGKYTFKHLLVFSVPNDY